MHTTLTQAGAAPPDEVWRRYADLDAWSDWAPFIIGVDAPATRLTSGLTGTVVAVSGLRVRFSVLAVDHAHRTWQWRASLGPVSLTLDHEVVARPADGTIALLSLTGAAPVVLAYLAPAQLALRSLVRP